MATISFEQIKYQNIKSTGNVPIVIDIKKHKTTLLSGKNGAGKCVGINTIVKIRNKITGEIKSVTIGDLYAQAKQIDTR